MLVCFQTKLVPLINFNVKIIGVLISSGVVMETMIVMIKVMNFCVELIFTIINHVWIQSANISDNAFYRIQLVIGKSTVLMEVMN